MLPLALLVRSPLVDGGSVHVEKPCPGVPLRVVEVVTRLRSVCVVHEHVSAFDVWIVRAVHVAERLQLFQRERLGSGLDQRLLRLLGRRRRLRAHWRCGWVGLLLTRTRLCHAQKQSTRDSDTDAKQAHK